STSRVHVHLPAGWPFRERVRDDRGYVRIFPDGGDPGEAISPVSGSATLALQRLPTASLWSRLRGRVTSGDQTSGAGVEARGTRSMRRLRGALVLVGCLAACWPAARGDDEGLV